MRAKIDSEDKLKLLKEISHAVEQHVANVTIY